MGYKKFKYKIFKKYFEKILFRSKWMYIKYSDPLIQIDRCIEIEKPIPKVNENCVIFNSGDKNVWLACIIQYYIYFS